MRALPTARGATLAAAAVVIVLVTACSGTPDDPDAAAGDGADVSVPASHDYRPGLPAYLHLPTGVTAAPVVVIIPGGGWQSADPTGLQPLAAALAEQGVAAMPVRIRAADDDVLTPVPFDDILCALADGVAVTRAAGIEPTRAVLLGHSSGAHLASVATLDPEQFSPQCEDPLVSADAFVGLAGPYDIRTFSDAASVLFASGVTSAEQDAVNPVLLADRHPEVPVLLLHGDADDVVPTASSTDFGAALKAAGHPSTVTVVPGADHETVYSAEVAAPLVVRWLEGLPQD